MSTSTMSLFFINFQEIDDMFLEFDDILNNDNARSSSVGDTSGQSCYFDYNLRIKFFVSLDGAQPTLPKRLQHSLNIKLKRYVHKNGKILITITLGSKKSISLHVILCFSNTIGVCVRDTFPVRYLRWIDVPPEYIEVVKGSLQVTSVI